MMEHEKKTKNRIYITIIRKPCVKTQKCTKAYYVLSLITDNSTI